MVEIRAAPTSFIEVRALLRQSGPTMNDKLSGSPYFSVGSPDSFSARQPPSREMTLV